MGHAFRLTEDRLDPQAAATWPPAPRALFVLDGELVVAGAPSPVAAGAAWHGTGACAARAGGGGARVLRYELLGARRPPVDATAPGHLAMALLEHPIALDPAQRYLMRLDRVDFAPGGVALPHRHQGGGIRCLLAGALEVRVGDAPPRLVRPGEAWFESGREPVLATASKDAPTSFVRASILPRGIRGRSSIVYVDPADAGRGTPRAYTVFVDEPIDLPA